MQEEVENRTVNLAISTTKLTFRTIVNGYNAWKRHHQAKVAQKTSQLPIGKQSIKELIGQDQGVSSIPIEKTDLKGFEQVARKYGVDYAITKDQNVMPSKYTVFFKAKDAGLRLAVYLKGKNAKKYRHGIEYGSARWGTQKDIEPYEDPVFANNVILTRTERLMMGNRPKNPANARNKNVLVVGGSGSNKTRFWLKPNLLQCHSSYAVTDPKGYTIRG